MVSSCASFRSVLSASLVLVLSASSSSLVDALQPSNSNPSEGTTRRAFFSGAGRITAATAVATGVGASSIVFGAPSPAQAGIDVSGLPVEGGGTAGRTAKSTGNDAIRSQLKAYDGSGSSRVEEIKAAAEMNVKTQSEDKKASPSTAQQTQTTASSSSVSDSAIATYALRYGGFSTLTKKGLGERYRLDDYVVGAGDKKVLVSFEFPSDWLELDRLLGGIQYVDQRNGDKVYLLRATLPPDSSVNTVPKSFFANAIFDPQGSISKGGNTIDEYKAGQSVVLSDTRRRLTMKYATVTGNGYRVERRALVDIQQIGDEVFMLMTSSNAVKFEAKGIERDTVEAIVDSFRCDRA